MITYEIIGKLPLLRKKFGFYRNTNSGKLAFGFYYKRVSGFAVGLRRTANSEEEAKSIACEMLASDHGFESVAIQNPQDPQRGAVEFRIDKNDANSINHK